MRRIYIILIFVIFAIPLFLSACSSNKQECSADSDCKLIYSGCTCEAVPVTDPRTSLDDGGKVCVWNDCYGRNAYAECINGKCEKSFLRIEPECHSNSDCAPADCCHAKACVPKSKAPDCTGVLCTTECKPGTIDCGGSCACENGKCVANIKKS